MPSKRFPSPASIASVVAFGVRIGVHKVELVAGPNNDGSVLHLLRPKLHEICSRITLCTPLDDIEALAIDVDTFAGTESPELSTFLRREVAINKFIGRRRSLASGTRMAITKCFVGPCRDKPTVALVRNSSSITLMANASSPMGQCMQAQKPHDAGAS